MPELLFVEFPQYPTHRRRILVNIAHVRALAEYSPDVTTILFTDAPSVDVALPYDKALEAIGMAAAAGADQ